MTYDDASPWLARGLYLFGVALMMTAAIDLLTTVWPMHPGDISWRYGFLGLGAGYLQSPTLGLVIIIATAFWQENAGMLRVTGVVCLGGSLALLLAMGMFGLDVLQMRELRVEEMQSSILAGGMFQGVKYFVAAFVLAFLGYGALSSAKTAGLAGGRKSGKSPGIVSSAG